MSQDAKTRLMIGIYCLINSFKRRYLVGTFPISRRIFMRFMILAVAMFFVLSDVSEARVFGRRQRTTNHSSSSANVDTSCAQGVAEGMARRNWVGHFGLGGTGLYEGCASGPTKEYAYNHCCFANDSSLKTVDVGYAQSSSGRWYCCRRYCR